MGKEKKWTGWMLGWVIAAILAGCSGSDSADDGAVADGGATDSAVDIPQTDEGVASDSKPDSKPVNPCPRVAGPADYDRKVIISHPFQPGGGYAGLFEVLELSAAGVLTQTGQTFSLSPMINGTIAFTPDGKIGIMALKNGKVGVVAIDEEGVVSVVHNDFDAGDSASEIVISPEGDYAYILSTQWRDVGGGIYRAAIGCDGSLTAEGLFAPSKLPSAMSFVDPGRMLVVAEDIVDSKAGDEVHLVDISGAQPTIVAGAPAFGDYDAIVSAAAFNGKHLLIADDDAVEAGNRLAVVELTESSTLKPLQVLDNIRTPTDLVISPFNNAAIVLNVEAFKITVFHYDPTSAAPFKERGALKTSDEISFPNDAVMITRGSLEGRVLTAENVAVRQIQFEKNGNVTDKAFLQIDLPEITRIVGAIGVQP